MKLFLGEWKIHHTVIALFLGFGARLQKTYCFVLYTATKCFNNFVQSAKNARREGNNNPKSGVVAETMNLLANTSYGYQNMDWSRHTVLKYLDDEKTHGAINNKMLKQLGFINDQL